MPKPSVALCRPKPMTSSRARAISPLAADAPIARPSAKLCRPMPTAISSESRRAGDQVAIPPRRLAWSSPTPMAPGPWCPGAAADACARESWRPTQRS